MRRTIYLANFVTVGIRCKKESNQRYQFFAATLDTFSWTEDVLLDIVIWAK